MRPIVVDVEHPEEVGAVQERRGAQRVEAFLHDRRADAFTARVVTVAGCEQGPAGRDGRLRERQQQLGHHRGRC